jgi:hypothetical protein
MLQLIRDHHRIEVARRGIAGPMRCRDIAFRAKTTDWSPSPIGWERAGVRVSAKIRTIRVTLFVPSFLIRVIRGEEWPFWDFANAL